jgi:hypothetical protein
MAYIGKNLVGVLKENRTVVTSTGDGSTSLELNETPGSVNNVLVFLDGIRQQPTTDYTVSGSMLTFTTGPQTGVKIVAIVGNHSGVEPKKGSVTTRKIVDGAVTGQKLADGNIPTSKFTGDLPALDGSNLLGVHSDTIHKSPNDPAINTNTIDGQAVTLGQMWVNTTSGEMYICTDVTENAQHWMNVGAGEGDYTNVPPTNPTNTGTFQDITESSSQTFTFDGATDADGSVTHYMVDQISNAALTVSAAEVAATTAHTFNTGAVGSDTAVTFRVRSKDNNGVYSSGVTVSMNVTNLNYIAATGGSTSPIGDYMYHTFTGNSSFNVTAVPSNSNSTIDYLVVGGGGGGGNGRGGGGGAGGYVASSLTVTTGNFGVLIGGGGDGGNNAFYGLGQLGQTGTSTSVSGLSITTATGGGGGGTSSTNGSLHLRNGASGGGGGGNSGYNGGTSTSQGNNGGNCTNSGGHGRCGAGGGGASGVGGNGSWPVSGDGGSGTTWLNGTTYAGGGGGGTGSQNSSHRGAAGAGGGGIGGWGFRENSSQTSGANCDHGANNTGGGGGGDGYEQWNLQNGNGGSGVVIIRYKYQN